eukprot:SAG22_NODE_131_length_18561_cov_10.941387_3_plen_667_part_00
MSKIREYRDDNRQLETHIGRLNTKQKRYDHHLAVIDRHWTGLDEGLTAILSRVDLGSAELEPPAAAESAEPSFLNQLLKKDVINKHGSDSEAEEIDTSLGAKVKFTTEVLQKVAVGLSAAEQQVKPADKDAVLLQRVDGLQAKNSVLIRERAAIQSTLTRCRQTRDELKMQVDSAEDMLAAERLTVKKLGIRLQEAESQSKEAAKNTSAAGPGLGGVASAGGEAGAGGGAAAAAAGPLEGAGEDERAAALLDAEHKAQERLLESTRLREQVAKLEQEALHLKQQIVNPSDDRIIQSSQYQALAFEFKAMDANHTKLVERFERLQHEHSADSAAAQEVVAKTAAATQLDRKELLAKLTAAEDQARTWNDRYEEARENLQRQALRPDSSEQVKELNLLVTSLRKELERVKKELKARPRTEETAELKQELAIKMETSEAKAAKLAKEKAEVVEELAEVRKKERQWAEKEKEYKTLLLVLQSASKDSRELTDVRTAERTAAAALAEAEANLAAARAELEALKTDSAGAANGSNTAADGNQAETELQKKIDTLQMKLKFSKDEEEGLVSELDEIGGAFEEMQEQNGRLLSHLKQKDDENFRLMSTRLKEQSKHTAMEHIGRAHEAKQAALTEQLAAQAEVVRRTEETFKTCQEQLVRATACKLARITNLHR